MSSSRDEVEFLKKIRRIAVLSKRLVKKDLLGDYKSAFRGMGMQFSEFRHYVYGDDVRHISWNVSARSQDLILKVFEEERERAMLLLVDVSASLRRGPWAQEKAERLAEIAATLALSAAEAKDKLGLILFSDHVEKVIPPASGKTHLLRIIRDVLLFKPKGTRTYPDLALKQVNQVLKKKAVVFYLSDMEVLPEIKTIKRCTRKHEFIGIHVSHEKEWTLPFANYLEVESAELGRPATLNTQAKPFRKYFESYASKHQNEILEVFNKSGAELINLNTTEDYIPPLKKFFQARKKGPVKSS